MSGANGSYIESDGEAVAHRRMEPRAFVRLGLLG